MRLKNRNEFPPGGGVHLLLPEVGMTKALVGSFREMCDAFDQIRNANKALAEKLGWPQDRVAVENWVEERECKRLVALGYVSFVDVDAAPYTPMPEVKKNGDHAVVTAKGATAAFKAYVEMVGPRGAVASELATSRAGICASCPKNNIEDNLYKFFTEGAVRKILLIAGALHRMSLVTEFDQKLGVCTACWCPLKGKVWAHLETIMKGLDAENWKALNRDNPRCWILSESGRE